jgi:hypothetical protein
MSVREGLPLMETMYGEDAMARSSIDVWEITDYDLFEAEIDRYYKQGRKRAFELGKDEQTNVEAIVREDGRLSRIHNLQDYMPDEEERVLYRKRVDTYDEYLVRFQNLNNEINQATLFMNDMIEDWDRYYDEYFEHMVETDDVGRKRAYAYLLFLIYRDLMDMPLFERKWRRVHREFVRMNRRWENQRLRETLLSQPEPLGPPRPRWNVRHVRGQAQFNFIY